ncbi:hypothetical protein AXFE_07270 [Acidithrix ferrooxidans]|jgi:hypothetical protein|uniref:Uncharacterized protein n=1 Tax=Acidithrix ferrooxidans TaxID=1280514 RepID=A0A0D8HKF6_9ACTN|nr:hypothetical protein AXFE_07270 [Acidithrix ferrooxidans]
MAKSPSDELKDLTYSTVGFALLGLQRLMVARNDLSKSVNRAIGDLANMTEHLIGFRRD